jgi:hypothetical protein
VKISLTEEPKEESKWLFTDQLYSCLFVALLQSGDMFRIACLLV